MKNVVETVEIVDMNGRFRILGKHAEYGSYSRRRDAVRAANRKGFTVAE